jgi:hypothetical protein
VCVRACVTLGPTGQLPGLTQPLLSQRSPGAFLPPPPSPALPLPPRRWLTRRLLPFPRRAHLKECFETLKRNIPNVDDKKTSNLSVLRTALRYIQVWGREAGQGGAATTAATASSRSAALLRSRRLPRPPALAGSPARLHAGAEHMAQLTSAGLPAREGGWWEGACALALSGPLPPFPRCVCSALGLCAL